MPDLLSISSIPIYVVKSLGHCHLIVAGGGGSSKTGVSNRIVIYEILATKKSCQLRQVQEIELESDAIMTGALVSSLNYDSDFSSRSFLATAGSPSNKLNIFNIVFTLPDASRTDINVGIEQAAIQDKALENEGYKCLVSGGNVLIGGGMNGNLTIWPNVNDLNSFSKFQAHSEAVDEVDVHPDGSQVITLNRRKGFIVWDVTDRKKLFEVPKDRYEFRSCKFSPTITKKFAHLYTVGNCAKAPSRLTKWDTQKYEINKQINIGTDSIMALAISKDDNYIGLGTALGSVYIHNTSNLKQIYSVKKAHSIFVTSLEFLPPSSESRLLTNTETCSLVSVSVDKKIILHRPVSRYGMVWRVVLFLLIYIIYEAFMNLV